MNEKDWILQLKTALPAERESDSPFKLPGSLQEPHWATTVLKYIVPQNFDRHPIIMGCVAVHKLITLNPTQTNESATSAAVTN